MNPGEQHPLDQLEVRLFDSLREMQDRRKIDGDFSWAPALAANHMRASMLTARDANGRGLHAVALSLTRQALEALMIIDAGLIATDPAWQTVERWYQGRLQAGKLRMWLAENEWSIGGLRGLWSEPWSEFVHNLSNALQPYAHFTPELLQWNLNMVKAEPGFSYSVGACPYSSAEGTRFTPRLSPSLKLWLWRDAELVDPDVYRWTRVGDFFALHSQALSDVRTRG